MKSVMAAASNSFGVGMVLLLLLGYGHYPSSICKSCAISS
ncbi:MAG: uncharacterized membrane protein YdcZ (DUF606 family) [Phenylobacterium sp.]